MLTILQKRYLQLIPPLLVLLGAAIYFLQPTEPAVNPDPNHTHADFAVWVNGTKLDFSDARYMSDHVGEEPADANDDEAHKHPYFHLHDGIGHVIHQHKPGLSIAEFFGSLGFKLEETCVTLEKRQRLCNTATKKWQMFVNGSERPFDPTYLFSDTEKILLTYGATPGQVAEQLAAMTDDACLYSKTCPERGDPPAENCISDPKVPCVAPLD